MTDTKCKSCNENLAWQHGYCPQCVQAHPHIRSKVKKLFGQEKQIQEAVAGFSRLVNDLSLEPDTLGGFIAVALASEHRTLQQSMIQTLFSAIKQYAELAGTDLRNEEAVKWAKKATSDEVYFPFV